MVPLLTAMLLASQVELPDGNATWTFWEAETLPIRSAGYSTYSPTGVPDTLQGEDLDGDGVADLVVVDINSSQVSFVAAELVGLRGTDLGEIWRTPIGVREFRCGADMDWLQDVDSDGVPDVLIGSPEATDTGAIPGQYRYGSAHVVSGATGAVLRIHRGTTYREYLGWSVAGLDDVDGDGVADYLVGATQSGQQFTPTTGVGCVRAYSGRTGRQLYAVFGSSMAWWGMFGTALLVADDRDGDGLRDFLVGDPQHRLAYGSAEGRVSLHSGATGAEIRAWLGGASEEIGEVLAPCSDLDGDGWRDFVTARGSPQGGGDRALVFYGAGHAPIGERLPLYGEGFAQDLATTPDLTGDGVRDLLVGAPLAQNPLTYSRGRIYLLDGRTGDVVTAFVGATGGPYSPAPTGSRVGRCEKDPVTGKPVLLAPFDHGGEYCYSRLTPNAGARFFPDTVSAGAFPMGVTLELDFPASEAGRDYLVILSTATATGTNMLGIPIPLAIRPLTTGYLLGQGAGFHTGMHGALDAQGEAVASLTLPATAGRFAGATLYACAISRTGLIGRMCTAAAPLEVRP